MKSTIGIFQGKQAGNNIKVLTILYDNGPLSAWGITGLWGKLKNKMSVHAILNKRLHGLAKKEYVKKEGKLWRLTFKGIIAVMLIQTKPRPWSEKWTQTMNEIAKYLGKSKSFKIRSFKINDREIPNPINVAKRSSIALQKFGNWVELSNRVKGLMDRGIIDFDVIKNRTLLVLILSEFPRDDIDAALGDLDHAVP